MQSDEKLYAAASKQPGFAEDSKQPASARTKLPIFKALCWKWEKRMAAIMSACLASPDGFTVRNGLLYLRTVSRVRARACSPPHHPAMQACGRPPQGVRGLQGTAYLLWRNSVVRLRP